MTSKMTIEKLAMMIQAGFKECYERLASKEDLADLRNELYDFKKEAFEKFATKEDLSDMEERLGNRWGNRIDRLEDDMRVVKTKLKLT